MDSPIIRPIEPNEVEKVVALWRRSREGAQPWLEARLGYSDEQDLAFFRESLLPACEIWVSLEGSTPVAFMALQGSRVEQLYVDPGAQGRGHGSALLGLAQERSPGGLTLFTHQRNEKARRFYERRGLRAVAFGVSGPPESEPDVLYEWEPPAV